MQNLLLLAQITYEGSFSSSLSHSPNMANYEKKSRAKTGVPLKNIFEGIQFTSNPLNDYEGYEKKIGLWEMYFLSHLNKYEFYN